MSFERKTIAPVDDVLCEVQHMQPLLLFKPVQQKTTNQSYCHSKIDAKNVFLNTTDSHPFACACPGRERGGGGGGGGGNVPPPPPQQTCPPPALEGDSPPDRPLQCLCRSQFSCGALR